MNVCKTEAHRPISAGTCGCKAKGGRIVAYTLIDSYHGLCLDKRDTILSEQLNILLGLLS